MNIVLIGYRASGKSTVGQLLATRLQMSFVDIDKGIMARYQNKSVAEIWQQFGEQDYRQTECDVTERACQADGQVIALGGGTPMQPRAFDAVQNTSGIRFFLEAPAQVLFERSNIDVQNAANRPSLTQAGGGLAEVELMLAKREPVYRELADYTIDVAAQSLEQAAQQIMEIAMNSLDSRAE